MNQAKGGSMAAHVVSRGGREKLVPSEKSLSFNLLSREEWH